MKSWTNLAITLTVIMLTFSVHANDLAAGFEAPYILMTPIELQGLPDEDRSQYVGRVRQMLSADPEAPIEFDNLSEARWTEAYYGLQKFCAESNRAGICDQLQEQRLAVFIARQTH